MNFEWAKKLWKWFKKKSLTGGFALWLAGATLAIGFLGGAFGDRIVCTQLSAWWLSDTERENRCKGGVKCSGEAGVFYGLILLFTFTFWVREREVGKQSEREKAATTKARKDAEDQRISLIDKYNELNKNIMITPPATAMTTFSGVYSELKQYIFYNVECCESPVDKNENITKALRFCLNGLTTIASQYTRISGKARFAGNIMRYRSSESIPADETEAVINRMKPNDEALSGIKGVLDLEDYQHSSSTDNNDNFAADTRLKPVAFPIPLESNYNSAGMKGYLPGAPEAYIYGTSFIYDTHELKDILEKGEYNIKPAVIQHGHKYFTNDPDGKLVRSFVSLAIHPTHEPLNCIGVINVHCDKKGIFSFEDSFAGFAMLVKPIISEISNLLILKENLNFSD